MNENKTKNVSKKIKINTYFTIWIFIASLSAILIFGIIYIIVNTNIDLSQKIQNNPVIVIGTLIIIQLLISILIAIIIGNIVIYRIEDIEEVINEVSNGNYKVRVKETIVLKELKHNFNKMISELDSIEILKNDFINNFSHEFKTPIVSIKSYAEELKRDDITDQEKQKYLDIIINELNRLTSLSTNILNLSKIEKQEILSNKTRVNIGEQIRKVIAIEYPKIERSDLELNIKNIDDCYSIVNEDLIEQVWINLIDNAIKFNKPQGTIEISVNKKENNIQVEINDTGIGIEKEKLNHIYDKFYTTSEKKGKSGNGLGLVITKKILDLHNAKIIVKSIKNKGTKFIITLKQSGM